MHEVTTYRDSVEHIIDVFQINDAEDRVLRNARRAVDTIYRSMPFMHRWSYYNRQYLFQSEASYSTGTITYDHTGGTYEREVTLDSGTWPDNAQYGVMVVSNVPYMIDRRISDTVITLKSDSNPGSDLDAGTSYTYFREAYLLPETFRKLGTLWDMDNDNEIPMVDADRQTGLSTVYYDTPDTPWYGVIRGSNNVPGRMQLCFVPGPSSERTYRVSYESAPREMKVENYATGTVTTSGTSVTLSGGTFPTAVSAGTVIRFSDSATAATSKYGNPSDVSNPYYAQRFVVTRDGDTTLTIDSALPTDQTSVAYSVSDPVDIENGAMLTAFLRGIEAEYARMAVLDNQSKMEVSYRRSLIQAMESDYRTENSSRVVAYDPFSHVTVTTED
jgi:hypothetical protein